MANKNQRRAPISKKVSRKAKPKRKVVNFNLPQKGLLRDINQDLCPKKPQPIVNAAVHWESIPAKPSKFRRISDFDREYITRLLAKHGEDYYKMFMDRKVNCDQLTMTQLRNMVAKLRESDEDIARENLNIL